MKSTYDRRHRVSKRSLLGAALLNAALLGAALGGTAAAQGAGGFDWGNHWRFHRSGGQQGSHAGQLQGATLTVAFYRDLPERGGTPTRELRYTVGESDDLQAAIDFLQGVQGSRYAVMGLEEVRVDLADHDLATLRAHLDGLGKLHQHAPFEARGHDERSGRLNDGAALAIDFFAEEGAETPSASLRYLHGETDDAEAFERVIDAARGAAFALVRVEDVVVDLSEFRFGHSR